MADTVIPLEELWHEARFCPNDAQCEAILYTDGPLFLPAGPGSGKTRVLLWRTLNLLVCHDVRPQEIYLSTFTEKAALQLKEGLQALLGIVTNRTGRPFDLSQMYVGTVHSLCQRLLSDRRFYEQRQHPRPPHLLDELGQYFHLYRTRNWQQLLATVGLDAQDGGSLTVYQAFGGKYDSKHLAVTNCIAFFNRLSEECIEPDEAREVLRRRDGTLQRYLDQWKLDRDGLDLLLRLYASYRESLANGGRVPATDFSLIQQAAYQAMARLDGAGRVFRHVIVDEYQDTNTIQERLFFRLAAGHGNLCVVGDDDQALYRFRGATVENLVQFPQRCEQHLGRPPRTIPLAVNYRSRKPIVAYYGRFMACCDWKRADGRGHYRVVEKEISAQRPEPGPGVVRTACGKPQACFPEIAGLVCELLERGVVQDPNQVAFLFHSLKSVQVRHMKVALEARGLTVYAPRAGRFLEVPESTDLFGVLALIVGTEGLGPFVPHGRGSYNEYRTWLHEAKRGRAEALVAADRNLAEYVDGRQADLRRIVSDKAILAEVVQRHGWDVSAPYDIARMRRPLAEAPGLSLEAQRSIGSAYFERYVRAQREAGHPVGLQYVLRRATSLDWTVLDAFYRICGTSHFRAMFDLAEQGRDEGPICNLALISQYLRRFVDEYVTLITADLVDDKLLTRLLFGSYLYALWRLGESEYEDRENPFPKGRIPFLTIHQAKGLEFPVVVLANPNKSSRGPQLVETMVRPFLTREEGEPLDRMGEFDIMRMFYVALSRAENLLVIADLSGHAVYPPFRRLMDDLPLLEELDLDAIPRAREKEGEIPKPYSYTGDYLAYRRCPRQYMIFRKYGFEASRTQTAFFGSLIHRTLDDLHNYLIARRKEAR